MIDRVDAALFVCAIVVGLAAMVRAGEIVGTIVMIGCVDTLTIDTGVIGAAIPI